MSQPDIIGHVSLLLYHVRLQKIYVTIRRAEIDHEFRLGMVQDPRKLQNEATLLVGTPRCLPTLAWIWAQCMKKMKWCSCGIIFFSYTWCLYPRKYFYWYESSTFKFEKLIWSLKARSIERVFRIPRFLDSDPNIILSLNLQQVISNIRWQCPKTCNYDVMTLKSSNALTLQFGYFACQIFDFSNANINFSLVPTNQHVILRYYGMIPRVFAPNYIFLSLCFSLCVVQYVCVIFL